MQKGRAHSGPALRLRCSVVAWASLVYRQQQRGMAQEGVDEAGEQCGWGPLLPGRGRGLALVGRRGPQLLSLPGQPPLGRCRVGAPAGLLGSTGRPHASPFVLDVLP